MALTGPGSCVHGIDFTSKCADCQKDYDRKQAQLEQSVRDKRSQFIRHSVLAQTHAGAVTSEGSAVVAVDVAEATWKVLEERGYA